MKLNRGQKRCKKCKSINAARQRICKNCQFEFISKNTPVKGEIKDWKSLEIGDYIKIIQGTGPYFINKKDTEESKVGDRICLGDIGVYRVEKKYRDGLRVSGVSFKNGGFSFLYMGKPKYIPSTGVHREPYRIKRVKRRKNVTTNSNSVNRK
jgi:hypothetical protein